MDLESWLKGTNLLRYQMLVITAELPRNKVQVSDHRKVVAPTGDVISFDDKMAG